MPRIIEYGVPSELPVIHVISDSLGLTGLQMARAAASQYVGGNPYIRVLSQVKNLNQVYEYLDKCREDKKASGDTRQILVFFTFADTKLSEEFIEYDIAHDDVLTVDLISEAIKAIGEVSGLDASNEIGHLRDANEEYFKRIEALEFTINHDDGRKTEELTKADIVLVGVSRSSKTPLSIYLAQEGFRVANVPLDPESTPPAELAQVESGRLFGLMTSPEILVDIRKRRLGKALGAAGKYADYEYICEDLESSRKLMKQLGCKIIHTENRAVEETAQEILRYYEKTFGSKEILS